MSLAQSIMLAALAFAPPETRPNYPGYSETRAETVDRYWSISQDIAAAATAEPAKPGGLTDEQEAALLLALAIGESGLALDVDRGPCYRRGGLWARCDSGTSFSIWQIKPIYFDRTRVDGPMLQSDRNLAARVALWLARSSLGACRKLDPHDRLSAYGAGHCKAGLENIRERFRLYQRVLAHMQAPKP